MSEYNVLGKMIEANEIAISECKSKGYVPTDGTDRFENCAKQYSKEIVDNYIRNEKYSELITSYVIPSAFGLTAVLLIIYFRKYILKLIDAALVTSASKTIKTRQQLRDYQQDLSRRIDLEVKGDQPPSDQ